MHRGAGGGKGKEKEKDHYRLANHRTDQLQRPPTSIISAITSRFSFSASLSLRSYLLSVPARISFPLGLMNEGCGVWGGGGPSLDGL